MHTNNGIMPADPDTVATVRAAAAALENAGAQVAEARPPAIEYTERIVGGLWVADGDSGIRSLLERYDTDRPHPWLAEVFDRELDPEPTGAELAMLLESQDQFRSVMLGFLEHWDLILCPVCAFPACPHGTWQDPDRWPGFSYTITYNVTGWPAVVVRCGTSEDGLPIGVQLVARPWREDVALAAAAYLEAVFGGWQPPPI
jgi:amidase